MMAGALAAILDLKGKSWKELNRIDNTRSVCLLPHFLFPTSFFFLIMCLLFLERQEGED